MQKAVKLTRYSPHEQSKRPPSNYEPYHLNSRDARVGGAARVDWPSSFGFLSSTRKSHPQEAVGMRTGHLGKMESDGMSQELNGDKI